MVTVTVGFGFPLLTELHKLLCGLREPIKTLLFFPLKCLGWLLKTSFPRLLFSGCFIVIWFLSGCWIRVKPIFKVDGAWKKRIVFLSFRGWLDASSTLSSCGILLKPILKLVGATDSLMSIFLLQGLLLYRV